MKCRPSNQHLPDCQGDQPVTELSPPDDLGRKIHRRFAKLGGVDLPPSTREAISTNSNERFA